MNYLITGGDMLSSQPDFKLVGRDEDLKRLSSILLRSKAASVILVGPGGVGATTLCMGLQAAKSRVDATFDIISKRLFWLKNDELFALGTHEAITKAFENILNIMKRTPDSILLIQDARDFIEGARNSGCSHFINALNSLVKSGKTQVILEVKDQDIDMLLGAHSDFRQLYTLIDVSEPTGDNLLLIVNETAKHLQKHHDIKIEPEAIQAAVELTSKYRTKDASLSRAQPERTNNLLDRALSTYRLDAHRRDPRVTKLLSSGVKPDDPQIAKLDAEFRVTQARIRELFKLQRDGEIEIINIEEQIEAQKTIEEEAKARGEALPEEPRRIAMFSNTAKAAGFESEKIRALRDQIRKLQLVINENRAEFDVLTSEINTHLSLTRDFVLSEFSRLSGIPANKLNEDEREKLLKLEETLNSRVFGQATVIKKIANAIKVARIGRRNGSKPQASFLIMGPSGTGKTEVCKAIAHALKDDESVLTRFDMSEYMEKHAVAKLIGAPPGYEGTDRGGILTNAMRANPSRIILFDEIEKAHPDVFDLFLQILDAGRLTDSHGRTVSFSESIIIMTTNIGQTFFLDPELSDEESEKLANQELDSKYRPEFLNRFAGRQNIVCFKRLELDSIQKIVRRELNSMNKAYQESGMDIIMSDESLIAMCKDHYDTRNGARGPQGYVTAHVEPLIADLILEDKITGNIMELVYDSQKKMFTPHFSSKE